MERIWDSWDEDNNEDRLKEYFKKGISTRFVGRRTEYAQKGISINLWELDTSNETLLHPQDRLVKDTCRHIQFSPDSKRLAIVEYDGGVRVFDTKHLRELFFRKEETSSVFFSPDGEKMALVGKTWIDVLAAQTGILLFRLNRDSKSPDHCSRPFPFPGEASRRAKAGCPLAQPHPISFSPDNKFIYVGVENGTRIHDSTNGQEHCLLRESPVPQQFSRDGRRYYSAQAIYDAADGSQLCFLKNCVFLGFSSEGRFFVTYHLSGDIYGRYSKTG